MKAYLKNYRQSPRKVRLVADLVRGKRVNEALVALAHLPKRAGLAISKLIASAKANATHNDKADAEKLVVDTITVDQGATLHRSRPRSRGFANPINKRTSNVSVVLKEQQNSV